MTADVTAICPKDRVCHDPAPIAQIYCEMDGSTAEKVVNRALGELALTICCLTDRVAGKDLAEAPRQLRRVQRMAGHLGMTTLCQIAGDARSCLERGEATAFSAVWARLLRVAETQLSPGKDLRDRWV